MANATTLLDAVNHLHETMDLQEAAFMAAGAIETEGGKQRNAIAAIIDHVSMRLADLEAMLGSMKAGQVS